MPSLSAARIDQCRERADAALIGYLTVGYPDVQGTIRAGTTLIENGFDILELGLPYSDPGMDGPVIQATGAHALAAGTRTRHVFEVVEALAPLGAPILVMTYYNPIFRYGDEAFARDLANAGGAGTITPDLIPDEGGAWIEATTKHDLDRVFLVAPSSTDERLETTANACRGFVYAASTMGVTGERAAVDTTARTLVRRTREAGAARVCVGLGVSSGAQAREIGAFADGVIVGSALLRALGDGQDRLAELAQDLAEGVQGARA
ncbi:MAG: tryptophan synthase subunit alpha [Bowdeniella nasicola]|nr:tryptophan synthase subunit alpha [Bowdeniella nasicola]